MAASTESSAAPGDPPVPAVGTTLVVMRHGRTAWNRLGRFQGHGDPPLDEVGRAQAAACADAMAALVARAEPDEVRLVSSDLRRARQTADRVATRLGVGVGVDPALREVDLGGWEGLTPAQAAARFPDEWAEWEAGDDVRRGGGETDAEAGRRVAASVEAELDALGPRRALLVVVGHGRALRAAVDVLHARGRIGGIGPAPHLANGDWAALPVIGDHTWRDSYPTIRFHCRRDQPGRTQGTRGGGGHDLEAEGSNRAS